MTEADILEVIRRKVIRDSGAPIDINTPLVSGGLLDSFAVFETLLELEKLAGRPLPPRLMRIEDFETVRALMTAVRHITSGTEG